MHNEEDKKAAKEQIRVLSDIAAYSDSKGGQLVLEDAMDTMAGVLEALGGPQASVDDLIRYSADIRANMRLVRLLTHAKTHKELARLTLERMIAEEKKALQDEFDGRVRDPLLFPAGTEQTG